MTPRGRASCVGVIGYMALAAVLAWTLMFVVTRTHMLQLEHGRLLKQRRDEQWLLARCQDDEFYHNMRQHSKLCDTVTDNQHDSVFLHALRRVIEQSYLCGYEPCLSLLEGAVRAVLRQGAPALAVGAVVLLLLPTVCLPLWRRQMNVLADKRYQALYHQPYGEQHFRSTDWRRRPGHMLDDGFAM